MSRHKVVERQWAGSTRDRKNSLLLHSILRNSRCPIFRSRGRTALYHYARKEECRRGHGNLAPYENMREAFCRKKTLFSRMARLFLRSLVGDANDGGCKGGGCRWHLHRTHKPSCCLLTTGY